MPCYRTHISLNLILGLPLSIWALHSFSNYSSKELFLFGTAFLYSTYFFHPDLDLAYRYKLFSLKGLLTLPFRPYSYLFKHRGISHVPVLGTLTRCVWIWGIFSLGLFLYKGSFALNFSFPLIFLIGFIAADFFHILFDRLLP